MRYPPIDLARDAEPSIRRLEPRIRKVRASHRPRPRERRESVAAIARYLRVGRSTRTGRWTWNTTPPHGKRQGKCR
jgi:hypothetical protein